MKHTGVNAEAQRREGAEGENAPNVRAMRDRVFEQASTDRNWDACGDRWLKPEGVEWLRDQVEKMDAKGATR